MTQHPLFLNVYMEICHHRLQREKCILQTLIKDQDFPTSLSLSDNTLLSTFFLKKMNDLAKVLFFFFQKHFISSLRKVQMFIFIDMCDHVLPG